MSIRRLIHVGRVQLGWPGALGAVGLSLCLALSYAALHPAQERLDAARRNADALQKHFEAAQSPAGPTASLDEQLAGFYRMFPAQHEASDWLGKVLAVAQRNGVSLLQAEYKVERDRTGRLNRFQVMLPLKGEYRTLRRFLLDLRTEIPFAALEQVQFERQKIGDRSIDAKVKLVIFLGRSS